MPFEYPLLLFWVVADTIFLQLTKEDEQAVGDEVEVRREDQDKINKFSRLHQRELKYEEELKLKNVWISPPPSPKLHDSAALWRTTRLTAPAEGEGGTRRHHNGAGVGRRGRHNTVSIHNHIRPITPVGTITSTMKLTGELSDNRYKIGDSFFHVKVEQAQEMLGTSTTKVEEDISQLEDKLNTAREEMTQLKVQLYARFGRSINLET